MWRNFSDSREGTGTSLLAGGLGRGRAGRVGQDFEAVVRGRRVPRALAVEPRGRLLERGGDAQRGAAALTAPLLLPALQAAYFPTAPSYAQQTGMGVFLRLFASFYPCRHCGQDFEAYLKTTPPATESCATVPTSSLPLPAAFPALCNG